MALKLKYWVAHCIGDSDAYSIRTKTKKECESVRSHAPGSFKEPKLVEVEYDSGFDLVEMTLGPDRGFWEY